MRNFILQYHKLTLTLILSFLGLSLSAQPAPCGPEPDMTSTCIEACVICDIDGYTGINDDTETGQAPPDFCTGTVHHMQWIAFIAGSTNLSLTVTVSNCNIGTGLEVGIYESLDCSTFNKISNCDGEITEGETGNFSTTQPLVIGQYYYFVMDGNKDDICNYTINVTEGSTMVPPLPPAGAVTGPDQICPNDLATFNIPFITGANFYEWKLDGNLIGFNNQIETSFADPGTYQLCVTAYNVCDTIAPSCKTIEVLEPQITDLVKEICASDCFEIADTLICSEGTYSFRHTDRFGCDSTVNLTVTILPQFNVNFETTICSSDSLFVGDNWYFPPGDYIEIQPSVNGCDSIISNPCIIWKALNGLRALP